MTSQLIDKLKFTEEMKVSYMDKENQQKFTHIKCAMLNFQGMAYMELAKVDLAKTSFQAALEIDSSYTLAKDNLEKNNTIPTSGSAPAPSNDYKKSDPAIEPKGK